MIDYTYKPKAFSNSVIIDYSYFEMLFDLLEYSIPVQPETIIGLSIFSEAVVLNEELIPTNNLMLETTNDYEMDFLRQFIDKRVLYYKYNDGFSNLIHMAEPIPGSGTDCMYNELISLKYSEKIEDTLEYYQKIDNITDNLGIPFVKGIYEANLGEIKYDFDNLKHKINNGINNSISKDLLSAIDNERFYHINKLKRRLGNRYVGLPSIITIILNRSKSIEDIPNQMLLLREEMTNFRDYCTTQSYNLRISDNFKEACEIECEVENAYNSFNFNGKVKNKRRLLQTIPDVSTDIISSGINIGKKLEECINTLKLKQIGYYDLRNKAFDVQHNLNQLKRLFGKSINDNFIDKLNILLSKK